MNVKCPYCGCQYDLDIDLLQSPSGNEKLGYGWWLRCYKCHKKWWLRNSDIEMKLNTPLRADKQEKIDRLSSLVNRKKPMKQRTSIAKYVFIILSVSILVLLYQSRFLFKDYITSKARRLSDNIVKKTTMKDVQYTLSGQSISVTGYVVNDDESIASISGIKVTIFDGAEEVLSWNSELDSSSIFPKQSVQFSTQNTLPREVGKIRVEVSIF
ncbi:MAG: hypothetical protein LBT03_01230 [Holosporales bacterium]|nr:hypothetical protein [Holosporales bacterium]